MGGCDGKFESGVKVDKCGVCGGDGRSCDPCADCIDTYTESDQLCLEMDEDTDLGCPKDKCEKRVRGACENKDKKECADCIKHFQREFFDVKKNCDLFEKKVTNKATEEEIK